MRYLAWALVWLLVLSGCASPTVRYHEENPNAAPVLTRTSPSHADKLAFVKKLTRERHGLDLTDSQAEQLVYLLDMRLSGKMTEAEARAFIGADEPTPYSPFGNPNPFQFYTFPNGQQVTCQQLGMMTNCY